MTVYIVTCQNSSGKKTSVTVTARTDEQACAKAVKSLNTWRALRALAIDPSKESE